MKTKWVMYWNMFGIQHSPFDMPEGNVNFERFGQLKLPIETCSAYAEGIRSFCMLTNWIGMCIRFPAHNEHRSTM
jgi:hypothetical protein